MMKKIFFLILFFFFLFTCDSLILAQGEEEILEGRVMQVLEEKEIIPPGGEESQLYQKLEVLITKGSLKDQKIVVESGNLPLSNLPRYRVGDGVVINYFKNFQGEENFYIVDYLRRKTLAWLFVVFVILTVAVTYWQGVSSLIGMGFSFLVIFKFILPRILAGSEPVSIAILGALMIIPITFCLSHGINKKTGVAIVGTVLSLLITGILANVFVTAAKLTGFAAEETGFLQAYKPGLIDFQGLLLAGIIIGVLGVLDDITISQTAIVQQLKNANPKLSGGRLYQKAMTVGKDHIASMVNTLILVYTGAALPLLLLFVNNPYPFSQVVNYEIIADEIVRSLVGSIGLILAVPLTTGIAVFLMDKASQK